MEISIIPSDAFDLQSPWIRADDAYSVGEIYALLDLSVWFIAEKIFLSVDTELNVSEHRFCVREQPATSRG